MEKLECPRCHNTDQFYDWSHVLGPNSHCCSRCWYAFTVQPKCECGWPLNKHTTETQCGFCNLRSKIHTI